MIDLVNTNPLERNEMDNATETPEPTATTVRPNHKRTATIGVAAGLLAGGAIGLVTTMPSLTSAATETTTEQTTEQTTEATTGETSEATDAAAEEQHEPGERIREALQPLVDDGTLDTAQADAVATHLAEQAPDRDGRQGRRGLAPHRGVVADLLGMDSETLKSELMAGNSVADIAEANGIDVQTVIDALVDDAQGHIDLAVEHGLDEERAAERLEQITERITDGVHRTPGERPTDG